MGHELPSDCYALWRERGDPAHHLAPWQCPECHREWTINIDEKGRVGFRGERHRATDEEVLHLAELFGIDAPKDPQARVEFAAGFGSWMRENHLRNRWRRN